MLTSDQAIDNAKLNDHSKADFKYFLAQVDLRDQTLPKEPPTTVYPDISETIQDLTVSCAPKKRQKAAAEQTRREFSTAKQKKAQQDASYKSVSKPYFFEHRPHFKGALPTNEPFRDTRDHEELTGTQREFLQQYADTMNGTRSGVELKDDDATDAAVEAYKKAFFSYMGRQPTDQELREVNRLYMACDREGKVGVIQKPHSDVPHSHMSCCHRRPVRCEKQVYNPRLPAVRGARDRFPGPIPVWSSTQNTHAMVAGDTHVPGHHRSVALPVCSLKTTTMRSKK